MPCDNCGGKQTAQRYAGVPAAEAGKDRHISDMPPYEEVLKDLNQYSLKTLLSMKEDNRAAEEARFHESIRYMSEALKTAQVMTYVSIANGDDFSLQGHSPEYCVGLLYRMLDLPEMAFIEGKFPGLKERVSLRYAEIQSKRIPIELSTL